MKPDALVAASYFVTQVQSVVSQCQPNRGSGGDLWPFQAGTTNNVITDTHFLHGTIRAWTQDMSLLVQRESRLSQKGLQQPLIWKSK